MSDQLKIDYDTLNNAKTSLQALADGIGPLFSKGLFATLGDGNEDHVIDAVGDEFIADALSVLYSNAHNTMTQAVKGLGELAEAFGSVGDAFASFDAQLAQGWSVTDANLILQNYQHDKALWDYKQQHADQCVPGPDGTMPDFCSATDPGQMPTEQTISTPNGDIHTKLTLDGNGNVVMEESSVTYNGQTYYTATTFDSTTTGSDTDSHSHTTTTYPDGSTATSDVHTHSDGSGSMVVTNSNGDQVTYSRGPKDAAGNQPDWAQTSATGPSYSDPRSGSGNSDGGGDPSPPPEKPSTDNGHNPT
ncbi:hypothetical protein [Streptomyces gibsoniae]|uniref:WXG100 family type VII secretion target n=1 Tax=Streptomyces gibsoniae TaxID=3075529 RepID=A0ABU2TPU5_9ACTN|nr:hypothetical protein [Streptomyces sp. DSM 41699]MDT0462967.1 hypothetical protein [Streptomyces sp. DSM 41699]